ncbi:ABC transporter ATP-binding protein [Actinospica sp. MGRD01-02]|uniref:ABC transporter ATP-binding protein n=1 Tax=Actinospica acidithermotolerans TaxID=2828514 RepID=A0A941EDV7_9ACTN|nr:ABC transporter ATP-binding protein [Actinospica acidithermotolerans]MBR7825994.1 ABC transporter ATP-binding protein [Actinospica acidithermotolerans]
MNSIRSAGEILRMAWRMDRVKMVKAAVLLGGGFLATPLAALGLRAFTNSLLAGEADRATLLGLLLAVLLMLELMGTHFAHLSYFELGEMTQVHLQHRLFTATNSVVSLARREQPDYANDLQVTQSRAWNLNRALEATLQFGGLLVQLCVSTFLLARLNWVLVLVPCLSVLLILASARAQRAVNLSEERAAEPARRARHFLRLATTPESLVELRLLGLEDEVVERHTAEWDATTRQMWRGQSRAALIKSLGQLGFALGYAGALIFVFRQIAGDTATVGDFVLVLALAVQTTMQISTAVTLLAVLQQSSVTIGRITRLADAEPGPAPAHREPIPGAGLRLEHVTFSYHGGAEPVLRDVNLSIPPGARVAVVGENGAGKTTLVKLMCGLYQPTSGRISLNGHAVDTGEMSVAALFQDFARVELSLRDSIGIGKCRGAEPADDGAVHAALERADTTELVDRLPDGLDGILGTHYTDGAELSGGQWQRVGLARALVPESPALLMLDEPAAALDPTAEHALFERFAVAAGAQERRSAITVYVSHRFSTVRMADLIVVMERGRVAAAGTHDELMRAGGTYAELYTMQARAYADV